VLRVCGKVFARAVRHKLTGVRIGAASAAGKRVAWIEEHHRSGVRFAVVTVAALGRKGRVLQRFTSQREHSREEMDLDVLLTRQGDVAWTAGTIGYGGVVGVKQPGRPMRIIEHDTAYRLALDDGRTVRAEFDDYFEFYDLRSKPCPSRQRFKPYLQAPGVLITRARIRSISVFRACNLATRRDHVIFQHAWSFDRSLSFIGIDRTWAVFKESEIARYQDNGSASITVVDALTGRQRFAYISGENSSYPAPKAGSLAVTDRGVLGWVSENSVYALVDDYKIVTLDQGGTIAGLHADGHSLLWTHDGAPRRFPRGGTALHRGFPQLAVRA